jgi:hypothetical protein
MILGAAPTGVFGLTIGYGLRLNSEGVAAGLAAALGRAAGLDPSMALREEYGRRRCWWSAGALMPWELGQGHGGWVAPVCSGIPCFEVNMNSYPELYLVRSSRGQFE